MNKFCIYKGVKVIKPETWDITSVELSNNYRSVIIQAESKSNKSKYTLDITPLINNQYGNGIDPYTVTIVDELTGVSDWVVDSNNKQVIYTEPLNPNSSSNAPYIYYYSRSYPSCESYSDYSRDKVAAYSAVCYGQYYLGDPNLPYTVNETTSSNTLSIRFPEGQSYVFYRADNPDYNPDVKGEEKYLPLTTVAQQVISNAEGGNVDARNSIVSTLNNMMDTLLNSDYSEFFEQNKQPK